MRVPRRLVLFGLLAPVPVRAQSCCGEVTADGRRLAAFLDASGVEHLWLAKHAVVWTTGEPDPSRPGERPTSTHCSAFVAAMARTLGIYILRPPDHSQALLASAQMRWLREAGAAQGWRALDGALAAQARANTGGLVVASFENPDPTRPGHIAIVRPSTKTLAELERDGPEVTQAGHSNHLACSMRRGFADHAGAWEPPNGGTAKFFAHDVAVWPTG